MIWLYVLKSSVFMRYFINNMVEIKPQTLFNTFSYNFKFSHVLKQIKPLNFKVIYTLCTIKRFVGLLFPYFGCTNHLSIYVLICVFKEDSKSIFFVEIENYALLSVNNIKNQCITWIWIKSPWKWAAFHIGKLFPPNKDEKMGQQLALRFLSGGLFT